MSEFEEFMKKLLEEKPNLSRFEIEEKIEQKKEKIGAGYLTDQGALFLVASDLGVSLLSMIKTGTPRTYEFDQLQIDKISNDDLESKFRTIRSARRTKDSLGVLLSVAMMTGLMSGLFIVISFSNIGIFLWVSVGVFIFCVSYVVYFIVKKPVPKINKQEKFFLTFYDVLKTLKTYQYRPNAPKAGKYIKKIRVLAYDIEEWTEYAPSEFDLIPMTTSRIFRTKIIPIFKNNLKNEILSFIDDFEKIIFFCYSKEPTIELMKKFNEKLDDQIPIISKKAVKAKTFDVKIFAGYATISPLVGLVVGLVMHIVDPTRVYDSFGYGIIAGIMIFVGILSVFYLKK